jgi:FkbM family methyltransferase
MKVRDLAKQLTYDTAFYAPLRDLYLRNFNRREWRRREEMTAFYSQFVRSGDLVFDVGSNIGEYTEVFLKLGARVVAIEPQQDCATILRTIRPSRRLVIEQVAVGASEGEAEFYVCDEAPGLSTLSPEWLTMAQNAARTSQHKWNRSIRVPVITLDLLIAKFGKPRFVKIDVEGSEPAVLSGLTKAPEYLSFEFNTEYISSALSCLTKSCFSPRARFNLIIGRYFTFALGTEFALGEWVSREGLIEFLNRSGLVGDKASGEIFVREPLQEPRG